MGLSADDAAMLRAALSVIRDGASREGVWARLPASTTGAGPAGFSLEWEHRLVFVAERHDERVPLHLVPAPVERVEPDETWAPEYDEEVFQ